MKKMRILQIFYEPHFSGITRHVLCLAKGLNLQKYDIRVLCSTRDEKIRKAIENLLGKDNVTIVSPGKFFSFRGAYEARKIISNESIDLIHIHNLQSVLWGYAAAIGSKTTRIVFTPHVINLPFQSLERVLYIVLRLLRPFTFRVISLSPHQKHQLINNGAASVENIRIIPNRLDLAEIRSKITCDPQDVRRSLNIPADSVIVCQMGRLVHQKNPLALVRIADEVCRRNSNVVFLLVGEGPLSHTVQDHLRVRGLESVVRLLGFRSDALDIANSSDIVTLTSLWEGLPYTLLEAVALHKPIISMHFPGVEDFIIHGATGFVANTESEFAGILTHLAENPVLRQEIGLRAFQSNGNFFDIAKMIRELEDCYGFSDPGLFPITEG